MIEFNGSDCPEGVDFRRIYLRQMGGRYCEFTCPNCGHPGAEMKMSANMGWCKKCGVDYQCSTLTPVGAITNDNRASVNYYGDLEVV